MLIYEISYCFKYIKHYLNDELFSYVEVKLRSITINYFSASIKFQLKNKTQNFKNYGTEKYA